MLREHLNSCANSTVLGRRSFSRCTEADGSRLPLVYQERPERGKLSGSEFLFRGGKRLLRGGSGERKRTTFICRLLPPDLGETRSDASPSNELKSGAPPADHCTNRGEDGTSSEEAATFEVRDPVFPSFRLVPGRRGLYEKRRRRASTFATNLRVFGKRPCARTAAGPWLYAPTASRTLKWNSCRSWRR
jgi:hypothetical protein